MLAKLLAQTFFTLSGWTFKNNMPADIKQCVMIAAPHTSNWDAPYTRFAFVLMGIPVKITIKDSWMRFPYGPMIRYLGGIGINRAANVPIALGYCDYAKKEVGVAKLVYPSGDIKKDMKEIMAFYKDITPHTPQNFSVDVDYDA